MLCQFSVTAWWCQVSTVNSEWRSLLGCCATYLEQAAVRCCLCSNHHLSIGYSKSFSSTNNCFL